MEHPHHNGLLCRTKICRPCFFFLKLSGFLSFKHSVGYQLFPPQIFSSPSFSNRHTHAPVTSLLFHLLTQVPSPVHTTFTKFKRSPFSVSAYLSFCLFPSLHVSITVICLQPRFFLPLPLPFFNSSLCGTSLCMCVCVCVCGKGDTDDSLHTVHCSSLEMSCSAPFSTLLSNIDNKTG